ncbi:MAG: class I SAM-dependent methyltransferase [Candidatus Sumerlaeia bacterium]|nr:class I SAM-dependent methyltransferase [Candidatus Sumerlaeia bacterium]
MAAIKPEQNLDDALTLIQKGAYEEGERLLGEIIQDDASGNEVRLAALGHRGYMRMGLGRFAEALADYEEVCRLQPDDSASRSIKARLLADNGNARDAIIEAAEVLRSNPKDRMAMATIRKAQGMLGLDKYVEEGEGGRRALDIPEVPRNRVIQALEEDPNSSFPTSIHPELGRLIYTIVRAIKPTLVVETGSFIGYSSLCILQALEDNDAGHLHCFDLFCEVSDEPGAITNYTSPILGRRKTLGELARGHIEEAGLSHRVTMHAGDSSTKIREYFQQNPAKVQLAFIDGDHTIEGALKDWFAVEKLLEDDGLVILHDTIAEVCGWRGPRYLLQELGEKAATQYQWVNFPTFDKLGLAVIQKRQPIPSPRFKPSFFELLADQMFVMGFWSGSRELRNQIMKRLRS